MGNKELQYEVPEGSICFDKHCIKLKFAISDIPIDFILGNVFLAPVEPHGSARLKDNNAGYFITVPSTYGRSKKIKLPYISTPRLSTMFQAMQQLDLAKNKLEDLKDLKETLRIEEQLESPDVQRQISALKQ